MSDSDSTEHISAADLTAGLPKSDPVTITTTKAEVGRLRRAIGSAYEELSASDYSLLAIATCGVLGHEFILDMDNQRKNAFCVLCGALHDIRSEAKR